MVRMPSIFVGHGSPMNAIAENSLTKEWLALANKLPRPKAILAISAHWYINGLQITSNLSPETIHDFSGFPRPLYEQEYPAPGSPDLVKRVQSLVPGVAPSDRWGLDHGSWSVLKHMYPDADIPVVQLSIDKTRPDAFHYELGRQLAPLRDEGVLIFCSGNIVHNFAELDWESKLSPTPSAAWAQDFVSFVKENLAFTGDSSSHPIVNWRQHPLGPRANPSPDHMLPLLYAMGSYNGSEPVSTHTDFWELGTLAMLSVVYGQ